uniref:Uncharacterized protein n=1 Tax=Parastrongyloides trichosuri TaxID=131310 RepID=A0A0N4ZYJ0_PARTI
MIGKFIIILLVLQYFDIIQFVSCNSYVRFKNPGNNKDNETVNVSTQGSHIVLQRHKTWVIFLLALILGMVIFCILKSICCCFMCFFISKYEKNIEKNLSEDIKKSKYEKSKETTKGTKTKSIIDTVSTLKTNTLKKSNEVTKYEYFIKGSYKSDEENPYCDGNKVLVNLIYNTNINDTFADTIFKSYNIKEGTDKNNNKYCYFEIVGTDSSMDVYNLYKYVEIKKNNFGKLTNVHISIKTQLQNDIERHQSIVYEKGIDHPVPLSLDGPYNNPKTYLFGVDKNDVFLCDGSDGSSEEEQTCLRGKDKIKTLSGFISKGFLRSNVTFLTIQSKIYDNEKKNMPKIKKRFNLWVKIANIFRTFRDDSNKIRPSVFN